VANREHPHRLLPLIDFVYNPINVGLFAVKQMPQFPSYPSSFRREASVGDIWQARLQLPPTLRTIERQFVTRQRSFPHKGFQDRGPRDWQTQ
jgi:hypothetical protein